MKVLLLDETINIKDYLITTNEDEDIEFVEINENDSEYRINDLFSSVDAIIYISTLKEKYYRNDDSLFDLFINKYVESLNKALIIYIGPSSQRLGTSDFSKSCRNREIKLSNMVTLFSSNIHLYRVNNIFGRWCDDRQCDYIMDICNKVVNDIPVEIKEEKAAEFNYIEDVKNNVRKLYKHNTSVTCVSVTPEEAYEIAKDMAGKLNGAKGPSVLCIPMKGWGACDIRTPDKALGWAGPAEGPSWISDPEKPEWSLRSCRYVQGIKEKIDLNKDEMEVLIADYHMNEPEFSDLMSGILYDMLQGTWKKGKKYGAKVYSL